MSKIDRCIKAVKLCTKALMKLSFRNYEYSEKHDEFNNKISNQNYYNNNY